MNKRDLKSLKDVLGRQGLTMDDLSSQNVSETGIESVQSFTFNSETSLEDGWYVGYNVHYNGVGMSNGCVNSESEEEEEIAEAVQEAVGGESSGFSSDPPSEDEARKSDSEESGEDGQLLYTYGDCIHSTKELTPVSITLHSSEGVKQVFEKLEVSGTKRIHITTPRNVLDSEKPTTSNGYQAINVGQGGSEQMNSHNSGLSHNFVIKLDESPTEKNIPNFDSILLDDEKLSQISKAMTNFTLPTPPGWENVDDSKLLDFIKTRI
ncbi:unnamed protein product [Caenorhabditis angaria]|uniref:Uncharacterized protein n=1 Tax=Caenorhabditis angaria TaxID=860376 RepID=A0A9P1IYE1_9PELO|nr:unnamed protein product [Caenorhabditis angaria]